METEHGSLAPSAPAALPTTQAARNPRRGTVVVFLGPDGSGKSTVIAGLQAELDRRGVRHQYHHLTVRWGAGGPGRVVTDPHGQPPRGRLASIAKLGYFLLRAWPVWLMRVVPARRRGEWIILDRYFTDLLCDQKRYRYAGPLWLARLTDWLMPRPDVLVVLHAPAEVIHRRKAEVPPEVLARLLDGYRDLAIQRGNARLVDVTASPAEVLTGLLPRLGLDP